MARIKKIRKNLEKLINLFGFFNLFFQYCKALIKMSFYDEF